MSTNGSNGRSPRNGSSSGKIASNGPNANVSRNIARNRTPPAPSNYSTKVYDVLPMTGGDPKGTRKIEPPRSRKELQKLPAQNAKEEISDGLGAQAQLAKFSEDRFAETHKRIAEIHDSRDADSDFQF